MQRSPVKTIKYAIKILPTFFAIKNFYSALSLLVKPRRMNIVFKDGINFNVGSLLDLLIVKEIFIDHEYKTKLKSPKVIIDIGANIGTASVYFGIQYPKAKIFSFEPAQKTFRFLQTNLAANKIDNVTAVNLGVGGKAGKRTFFVNDRSGLSSLFVKDGHTTKKIIAITTLRDIFQKYKINKCDLLKIDCEGAEYEILFTTSDLVLNKIKNIIMEYHDGATEFSHKDLEKFLKSKRFKISTRHHDIENHIGIIYAHK